jgi:hypothetical protein
VRSDKKAKEDKEGGCNCSEPVFAGSILTGSKQDSESTNKNSYLSSFYKISNRRDKNKKSLSDVPPGKETNIPYIFEPINFVVPHKISTSEEVGVEKKEKTTKKEKKIKKEKKGNNLSDFYVMS